MEEIKKIQELTEFLDRVMARSAHTLPLSMQMEAERILDEAHEMIVINEIKNR